jgi:hypothetical protein
MAAIHLADEIDAWFSPYQFGDLASRWYYGVMNDVRILLPSDRDAVMAFAKERLARAVSEPMEREMQSWNARWRAESLDHYLPQGWSFAAFTGEGAMLGFLLAQPFLFYRGLTQTLWVEHLEFTAPDVGRRLLETAYSWARDKHLQCVLVENSEEIAAIVSDWPRARLLEGRWVEIRSARFA